MNPSPKYSLNSQDLEKIMKGAVIALAGALLTYIAGLKIDFGTYTPVATAILAILVSTGWKWLDGNK